MDDGLGCFRPPSPYVVKRTFRSAFEQEKEHFLPTDGPHTTLQVRRLDFRNGHILTTDSRTKTLKIFDSSFVPIVTIGRNGEGPGEFLAPFDAAFLSDGRVVAVDPELARVSVFTAQGEFLQSFLSKGQDPRRLARLDHDRIAIGGLVDVGRDPRLVGFYDLTSGERIAAYAPPPEIIFQTRMIVDDIWVIGDGNGGVFAGLAIDPTIVHVSAGGEVCTRNVAIAGWQQLSPPEAGIPTSLPGVRDWIRASSILLFTDRLPDGTWVRHYRTADALFLYVGDATGATLYSDLPGRVVGVQDNDFYLLENLATGVKVSVWTPKVDG